MTNSFLPWQCMGGVYPCDSTDAASRCRREEVRNRDGIPLLKRGSRGKGAAFPIQSVSVPPAVLRSSRQGQSLRLQIAALQILGLKQVRICPTWLKHFDAYRLLVVRSTSKMSCWVHAFSQVVVIAQLCNDSAVTPDICKFLLWHRQ